MTWERLLGLYQFRSKEKHEIYDAWAVIFENQKTGEMRFFAPGIVKKLGEKGILKILNSPTPALASPKSSEGGSSQSGE